MHELIQVGKDSFYIKGPTNIGLVRLNETDVCLIDSGSDDKTAEKILNIINENNWKLTAIYNSHSNGDHIGGNNYLQAHTGCRIFAPGIECAFTNYPILQASFIYGGFPTSELGYKLMLAKPSRAELLTEDSLPEGLSAFPLPGHFFDMVGYRTRDDVVFIADSVLGSEVLGKFRLGFMYDVGADLKTLEMLKTMKAAMFVPAHTEAVEDITPIAQNNIDHILQSADRLAELCSTPQNSEALAKVLICESGIKLTFERYVLFISTLRSYLSWMKAEGRLEIIFKDGELLWKTIE